MHPLFTFPASFVIENYGTYVGILIGSVMTIIGVCVRVFIEKSFFYVILGNIISGIGRPFI
jgi:FLVCR family feline leukemia virus subgroup C receptor-related protein